MDSNALIALGEKLSSGGFGPPESFMILKTYLNNAPLLPYDIGDELEELVEKLNLSPEEKEFIKDYEIEEADLNEVGLEEEQFPEEQGQGGGSRRGGSRRRGSRRKMKSHKKNRMSRRKKRSKTKRRRR